MAVVVVTFVSLVSSVKNVNKTKQDDFIRQWKNNKGKIIAIRG